MKKAPKRTGAPAPSRPKKIKTTAQGIGKRPSKTTIRLLIADDHVMVLEGLAATIGRQDDMTVVAKASNGRDAVELWKTHRPDISLLDLRMPMLKGVGVIRELRDIDVSARAIVETNYDTDEEIYQAIKAGAKGYLLKDASLEELLDSIRKVYAGETCIPPALGAKLASRMSGDALTSREIVPVAGEQLLTDEERQKQSANYLMQEINARVAAAPIGFTLYAQVAERGDRINDPSIAWPDNRKRVLLGRLEIKRLAANTTEEDRRLVFNPSNVPTGIETADMLSSFYSKAFRLSAEQAQDVASTARN